MANRSRRQAHGPQRRSTPKDFTATGRFDLVDEVRWEWSIELTSDQIARLFATFSDWSSDEVEAARQAADNCGGTVTEHYATDLQVLARRLSGVVRPTTTSAMAAIRSVLPRVMCSR